jgi:hypothetical protein
VRESTVRERTRTVNQMHGFLLEFGISLPIGKTAVTRLAAVLATHELPPRVVAILERLYEQFKYLDERIGEIEQELVRQLAENEIGQRLMSIPGVGPVTASVLTVKMGDAKQYECSRDFAAWVELVPRYYSTGGKANLLGISRHGDKNVKRLLVLCVRAYMRGLEKRTRISSWRGEQSPQRRRIDLGKPTRHRRSGLQNGVGHRFCTLSGFVQILDPPGSVILAVRTTANHVAGGDSADNPAKRPCACTLKSNGCGTDDAMKKVTAEPKVTKQIPKNTMSITNLQ